MKLIKVTGTSLQASGPFKSHRAHDNIIQYINIMDWIHLAQDRNQWWALLKMVMNLQVPQKVGNFLI